MTDDDLFHRLDDPAPPAPSADMLEHAVSRGRSIRRRRQSLSVLAAASILAVIGGVAAVVNAQDSARGPHDNLVPAHSGTPAATASAPTAHARHHRSGGPNYGVGAQPPAVRHQNTGGDSCVVATPPVAAPATPSPTAAATDTPAVVDSPTPGAASEPTPSATATPHACTSPTPSPSPSGTPSAQPTLAPTATPSAA